MLTHEGINFSSHSIAYYERSTENDLALCFLPFNHVFGQMHIMNATILSAGCLEILPAFDLDRILEAMEGGRVTKFFAVPTVYIRLLALEQLEAEAGEASLLLFGGGQHGDGDRQTVEGTDRAHHRRILRDDGSHARNLQPLLSREARGRIGGSRRSTGWKSRSGIRSGNLLKQGAGRRDLRPGSQRHERLPG